MPKNAKQPVRKMVAQQVGKAKVILKKVCKGKTADRWAFSYCAENMLELQNQKAPIGGMWAYKTELYGGECMRVHWAHWAPSIAYNRV